MSKLGFVLMVVIAAAVSLASCDTQPRGLFADESATPSSKQPDKETESGS
jgi:hypothetical protein